MCEPYPCLPLMREVAFAEQMTEGEKMKDYNRRNIPLAKHLRKTMTPWERKLWYTFLRFYPLRFQRQKAIGDYIADFYCAKVELVIELDGSGHYSQKQEKADQLRTDKLESMNLTILRICNLDIDRNFNGVCQKIDETVKALSLSHRHFASRSALTAPSSEGAKE